MITLTRWRKKPVEIEAVQWDGCSDGAIQILGWMSRGRGHGVYWPPGAWDGNESAATYLSVETLEGQMLAQPGDWIIRGVQGEFYPCKPSVFEQTYEPAECPKS